MSQRKKENFIHVIAAVFLLFFVVISPASFSSAFATLEWETQETPMNGHWKAVTWSPSLHLFVAVGESSVMTSPNGLAWTSGTIPEGTWNSVVWSPERNLFVAVGFGNAESGNDAVTSSDGLTWTSQTTPTFTAIPSPTPGNSTSYGIWNSVTWSPERGLFVAVGQNYTDSPNEQIMTSSDGITWSFQTSLMSSVWYSIAWSPALGMFVGVGDENTALSSVDGITWEITPPIGWSGGVSEGVAAGGWYSVAWSADLGMFVAVSDHTAGKPVMTSVNGTTWMPKVGDSSHIAWKSVAWSSELGIWAVVSAINASMISFDGNTWTYVPVGFSEPWSSLVWSPELGIFVAVADSTSSSAVLTSRRIVPSLESIVSVPHDSTADISWSTDIKSSTKVEYGIADSYDLSTTLDSTLTRTHTAVLPDLLPCTEYHYRVISSYVGEIAVSDGMTVTTTGCPEPEPEPEPVAPAPSSGRRNGAPIPPPDLLLSQPSTATGQDVSEPEIVDSEEVVSEHTSDIPTEEKAPEVRTPLFTQPLSKGMTHPDVHTLQVFLNAHGYTIARSGKGSAGKETNFYGALTAAAVARFQQEYREQILVPLGLSLPTGTFGPATMAVANTL